MMERFKLGNLSNWLPVHDSWACEFHPLHGVAVVELSVISPHAMVTAETAAGEQVIGFGSGRLDVECSAAEPILITVHAKNASVLVKPAPNILAVSQFDSFTTLEPGGRRESSEIARVTELTRRNFVKRQALLDAHKKQL